MAQVEIFKMLIEFVVTFLVEECEAFLVVHEVGLLARIRFELFFNKYFVCQQAQNDYQQ